MSLEQHNSKEDTKHDEHTAVDVGDERAYALRMARAADPGPGWASLASFRYLFIAFVACSVSGDVGFDGTIISSVNSMTQFQEYFNLGVGGASGQGLVFGIYTVGSVVGFFPGIIIPDKFGRRWAQFIADLLIIIGSLVNGFASNMGMLLAGRFLVGLGSTMGGTAAKAYLAEISSPWNRGFALGVQNSFWYVGNILASGVAIPFGRLALGNNWSWRVPFLLQMMLALINFFFIMLCPESPRWLYSRGKKEEAALILAKLHSRDNDVQSPLVQLQLAEFEESISLEGADKRWWDFRPIFTTAADRYRFGMCIIVACWGQLSGNGMVSYFLPTLLKQAGITSTDRQRVLNFASSIVNMAGAMTGAAVIDHIGRRPLMLGAEIWAVLCFAIVTGLVPHKIAKDGTVLDPPPPIRANAGITFIMLWSVFFSFGWTPLQGLYPTEVLAYEVRAKGLALQSWFANVFSLINTFGIPSALEAINWKLYLVFMAWDIVGCVVIYLWVVETKQLSLEEMDDVFGAKNPVRKSKELTREAKRRLREERAHRVAQA
ncbi:general substrate transporter [Cutaneotrichosporon oleaginosum]|uniref:General substrate transporter n=1 Tax=Cutaneotrichosporon oleaginosum TaxID=879819 RepID=A0A0J0XGM9_9TREE|nr:general substrate transporter [Cutaneotrichosporon oleaginosum]KLT40216.1 general substrate transporter [Cutaneotrichosporon oleaginosum]TXT10494.1 hypothetical protein COLE_04428 [Cutaneotrichosporon oleaginosum]